MKRGWRLTYSGVPGGSPRKDTVRPGGRVTGGSPTRCGAGLWPAAGPHMGGGPPSVGKLRPLGRCRHCALFLGPCHRWAGATCPPGGSASPGAAPLCPLAGPGGGRRGSGPWPPWPGSTGGKAPVPASRQGLRCKAPPSLPSSSPGAEAARVGIGSRPQGHPQGRDPGAGPSATPARGTTSLWERPGGRLLIWHRSPAGPHLRASPRQGRRRFRCQARPARCLAALLVLTG